MQKITNDTKEGEVFEGKHKKISWERLWAFSGGAFTNIGWPKRNVHTDPEFAKECGLSTVVASGTQIQGHVVQLMVDLFGVEWLSHGTMDVRFIGAGALENILMVKAVVKSRETEADLTRFVLEVWVENQQGEKILNGSISGIVPNP